MLNPLTTYWVANDQGAMATGSKVRCEVNADGDQVSGRWEGGVGRGSGSGTYRLNASNPVRAAVDIEGGSFESETDRLMLAEFLLIAAEEAGLVVRGTTRPLGGGISSGKGLF